MPLALTVNDLHKHYGSKHVVRGVSLQIHTGECVGILGPNGAGKSTTLNICLGKTTKDCGDIHLLGYAIPEQMLAARQRIGVVPQLESLDPDFTCRENLTVYARYFGMPAEAVNSDELLAFAGLSEQADDSIATLSGGMRRRLTLARALVNNPDFIFLDEPTTGLDPQARHLIWDRLRQLMRLQQKTLLLTTHFLEEAERLCDRIYIIDGGRLIAHGSPDDLISHHIEQHAVEIYGDDADSWLATNAHLYARREQFGQMNYCYMDDADAFLHAAQNQNFQFVHRKANLEDVFLSLTGRELRD